MVCPGDICPIVGTRNGRISACNIGLWAGGVRTSRGYIQYSASVGLLRDRSQSSRGSETGERNAHNSRPLVVRRSDNARLVRLQRVDPVTRRARCINLYSPRNGSDTRKHSNTDNTDVNINKMKATTKSIITK